jgi:hypothetical protein
VESASDGRQHENAKAPARCDDGWRFAYPSCTC